MLICEVLDVHGFLPAIHGMRNPKNSWDKMDSFECPDGMCLFEKCPNHDTTFGCPCEAGDVVIGNNDMKLMKTLFGAGTEHRKFDRMIQVWVDITAPLYWWKEFDTYKIGTVANSCSTMHKIQEHEFSMKDFSTEHLTINNKMVLEGVIDCLNEARLNFLSTKDKLWWWQMIQMLPSTYMQKRTVMLNYEVIARIIQQRHNHKLDEWHQLIDVLGELPYLQEVMN